MIPKGSPICLDYGSRPLRDLLRGYAFVPKVVEGGFSAAEIFEDFSCSLARKAALVVDASGSRSSTSLLRLASVRLLSRAGGEDPALEFGRARIVFVVVGGSGGGSNSSGSSGSASPVIVSATEEELPMQPEAEAGVCRWVARECDELASEIEGRGDQEDEGEEGGRARVGGEGGKATAPRSSWLSRAAEELASDYRAARVSLLRRCSESLEAQAWLVESCLGAL